MFACQQMRIIIAFFAAFKVANITNKLCGIFWHFFVRHYSANILIEKMPKSFSLKSIKIYHNNLFYFLRTFYSIMLRRWKIWPFFHKVFPFLKIGHFFCPFLIFGNTFALRISEIFFKFTFWNNILFLARNLSIPITFLWAWKVTSYTFMQNGAF